MKLRSTLALSALMLGAGVGSAAAEGFYIRGDVGLTVDGQVDVSSFSDAEFDDNEMYSVGAGYGFNNGFRLEGEFASRDNEFDGTIGPFFIFGDANVTSVMANLYYDFNRDGRIQPYLGVGGGVGRHDIDGAVFLSAIDSDSTDYAYQGLAGVNWQFTDNWSVDVGYRYFTIPEADIDTFVIAIPLGTVEESYVHQAVTVGLRYTFGAPAPAPVVEPPVQQAPPVAQTAPPAITACPTGNFVVYFEWDRSNLTQDAVATIDAAVNQARRCNISGVVLVGHTDTSGSTAYNQGLSERRASVVRDALVARGIAAGSITTQARGETDLAAPTRDGVREPLNRRTAITISFG
jgi:OOP family OmpA-OmpF porin